MQLLIAGDLVPTQSNMDLFCKADVNSLFGDDLLQLLNSADHRIFNLEAPLTDIKSPIEKCGPNLIIPAGAVSGIKALNPSLVTLANNHIFDQGEQGLKSTIDVLNKNCIPFTGAGYSLEESGRPYVIKQEGLKIGIYACAEHEFSIAKKSTPGANPFDPLESPDHISSLKNQCDYCIVLYHGGKEHYRYPSPYLRKVCRKIAEKGADLVICQHSHSIGCMEDYKGSIIVYGQGNFLFDSSGSEFWQTGMLIKAEIKTSLNIEFIPLVKRQNGVRLAHKAELEEILSSFRRRSEEIIKAGFIENRYEEFAEKNAEIYLRSLSGTNKWIYRMDKYLLKDYLLNHKYSREKLLKIQNHIECEAHRELLLQGLRIKERKK